MNQAVVIIQPYSNAVHAIASSCRLDDAKVCVIALDQIGAKEQGRGWRSERDLWSAVCSAYGELRSAGLRRLVNIIEVFNCCTARIRKMEATKSIP